MFLEFASSAGAFQCSKQNENAGHDRDDVKQHDKWPEVYPEPEQPIDNQIKGEQNHSDFLHVAIFAVAASLCRGISTITDLQHGVRGQSAEPNRLNGFDYLRWGVQRP